MIERSWRGCALSGASRGDGALHEWEVPLYLKRYEKIGGPLATAESARMEHKSAYTLEWRRPVERFSTVPAAVGAGQAAAERACGRLLLLSAGGHHPSSQAAAAALAAMPLLCTPRSNGGRKDSVSAILGGTQADGRGPWGLTTGPVRDGGNPTVFCQMQGFSGVSTGEAVCLEGQTTPLILPLPLHTASSRAGW